MRRARELIQKRIKADPLFALAYYRREARYAERKYGPDTPQALSQRLECAVALHRAGDSVKAEAELADVLSRRGLGQELSDAFMRHGKQWHARVLEALGRWDDAEPEWRELAAECDRLLGPDHAVAIEAHENHAVALARLDRVAEAEAEMAGVVRRRTAGSGADDADTLRSRTSHAVYLSRLHRLADSEAAWRGLAEAKARILGADHAGTITARQALADSLYRQRRLREAAAEYGAVAALGSATLGDDHADTQRARRRLAEVETEISEGLADSRADDHRRAHSGSQSLEIACSKPWPIGLLSATLSSR